MPSSNPKRASFLSIVIYTLFFLSGFIALIYEVLWMKELGLLFGNTAHASATVLTAFFVGLGAGNFFWGRRSAQLRNPLRIYGYLELAVAASALGYFAILGAYRSIYPWLFERFIDLPEIFLLAKFGLSLLLLFPPAFFMGGTLPVMSHFLVQQKQWLGQRVSVLYGINTLGAASGTLIAGFVLPPVFGFQNSFMLAILANLLVAIIAILLGKPYPADSHKINSTHANTFPTTASFLMLAVVAFASGLITLSLQVLWVRMFSQVLHNSVYTFSIILTVFLLILAFASWFANRLMHWFKHHELILLIILLLAGGLVIGSPFLFAYLTNDLAYVQGEASWLGYILHVFHIALLVMGPALLFLGAVLPMTFKLVEHERAGAGYLVGMLTSINTLGAVIGSFLAGFVLLESVGLWPAIQIIACLCLGMAIVLAYKIYSTTLYWLPVLLSILLFPAAILDMTSLPKVKLVESANEKLVELWEGSGGTVAVTDSSVYGGLRIKVNNHYTLGGSGARLLEELQTDLAMLLHPKPDDVYILGLGSGITAGAALRHPLQQLTVTELVPNVIVASEKHFTPFVHGLFTDPRAGVIAEDGRNYLEGTRQHFDVIIADLFVPWRSGAGYLYTQEHFQAVSQRLKPAGLFMQWLPSHQMTAAQFKTIARTFASVFPQTTLWRSDFISGVSFVALMGQMQPSSFNQDLLARSMRTAGMENFGVNKLPLLSHYLGNLSNASELFADAPLNTDDFPFIVYDAPKTQRLQKAGKINFFNTEDLVNTVHQLRQLTPLPQDPYLQNLTPAQLGWVSMGEDLQSTESFRASRKIALAKQSFKRFQSRYKTWQHAQPDSP